MKMAIFHNLIDCRLSTKGIYSTVVDSIYYRKSNPSQATLGSRRVGDTYLQPRTAPHLHNIVGNTSTTSYLVNHMYIHTYGVVGVPPTYASRPRDSREDTLNGDPDSSTKPSC